MPDDNTTTALGPQETAEQVMARYRAKLAERAADLSKQISAAPSNVIRTKGRIFTLPDGTTHPGPFEAVIVDFVAFNSFFEGAYNATKPVPPVCWATGEMDSLQPSQTAPKRQHEGPCATCPKNQWGSATNGGKGKACKNQLKLAVIPANLATADPSKIYTLSVSPTGIKLFSAFARRVQKSLGDDALPIRVVCKISFDPNQSYPTLVFTEAEVNEKLGVALTLLDDARELLMREPKSEDE